MQGVSWRQLKFVFNTSLWAVPIIAIPFALLSTRVSHWLDDRYQWPLLEFGVPGAQAMLQSIVTAILTFIVFTFGSLLVAIQVASGQMTPRIIATIMLRNSVVRYTVALFMFTLLFAVGAQGRLNTTVHQLPLFVAALLAVACFAAFLYLIDYASRLLRPIAILTLVGNAGLKVIESVYPEQSPGSDGPVRRQHKQGRADRVVQHSGHSGIVLRVDTGKLMLRAIDAAGIIEVVPQVGDFVATDEPLFNLYGGASAIADQALRSTVEFGSERTIEQDPTFPFRIVIDIALKALSPAINDPTTAVLAVDQLHRLLRSVGKRNLRTEELVDNSGELRVMLRTPNWEDFVNLTFSEIRACGADNLQIVRRLRAMIENLKETLPSHRYPDLDEQLELLDHEAERRFQYPEEIALARVGDTQGLGGHSSRSGD
jgi:uncharacterized membrane protein